MSNRFKSYLETFIIDLSKTFPEYSEDFNLFITNYNDTIINQYCTLIKPIYNKMCNKNGDILNEIKFIPKKNGKGYISFKKLFMLNISDNTKDAIWKYFNNLYVLGIVETDIENASDLLNNQNQNNSDDEENRQNDILNNVFKNMPKNQEDLEEKIKPIQEQIEKTQIGKIAKEVIEELNFNSNLKDGEGNMESVLNLFSGSGGTNLFTKISSKINDTLTSGNFNQEDLINEAQTMASQLQNTNLFGNLFKDLNKQMPNSQKRASKVKKRLQKKLQTKNKK